MTSIQVTAPCSAPIRAAAARAPAVTTATRARYGQARLTAVQAITEATLIVAVYQLATIRIPTPTVCAVSWIWIS